MMQEISDPTQWRILLTVVVASLLGGIIGFDRERHNKPAGMRTNMIVAGVACLIVSLGYVSLDVFSGFGDKIASDPLRIIQAVIIGVSFIGGGTILKLKDKEQVRNISTAATLLYSAAVGLAMGLHLYVLAAGITVFAYIVEYGVLKLEKRLKKKSDLTDLD
jgi:putative Mg2+ transporter-C (MgtC) family protein